MDTYKTDEEQIESLKKWWDENGTSVVFGIVVGLGAIFGWRWWQQAKIDEAEAASQHFQSMMEISRSDDLNRIKEQAGAVIDAHGGTTYAVFAELMLAKIAVQENDLTGAERHLHQALEDVSEKSMEQEIRLRLARVLVARDAFTEAENILNGIDPGEFASNYNELRGDIRLYQGDEEGARQAYQEAIALRQAAGSETAMLELKLEDLGHVSVR